MSAAPIEGEYVLISGFPPKPLDDPSKTIEQAGLKNAAITQKIIWADMKIIRKEYTPTKDEISVHK